MTDLDPMAQAQAEREILRLVRDLTSITQDVAEGARNEAKTEVAYKLAYAKRRLYHAIHGEGTVPEKDAAALLDCAEEFEAMKMAEAVYKACQESGRNARASLDALRSINANIRPLVEGRF